MSTSNTTPITEDDSLPGWRPLVDGTIKADCVAEFEKEPILARAGMDEDIVAAICIERYFPTLVAELAQSLKGAIPERKKTVDAKTDAAKAAKKSRGTGSQGKKATTTEESTGAANSTEGEATKPEVKPSGEDGPPSTDKKPDVEKQASDEPSST